jgi:hypothetical protein
VRAAPHEPAADHLIVDRADPEGHRGPRIVRIERARRHRQQHPERRALRGRGDEVRDLEAGMQARTEPRRRADDRPPEQERGPEEVTCSIACTISCPPPRRRQWHVPHPDGRDSRPAAGQNVIADKGRAARRPAQGRREPSARAARQSPQDEGQRIAEQQERRRHHRQQQVLSHVGRESLGGELVERREQRARDEREPQRVGRRPPERRRVPGGVKPAPPARVGGRDRHEHECQERLENRLNHRPPPSRGQCRPQLRALSINGRI